MTQRNSKIHNFFKVYVDAINPIGIYLLHFLKWLLLGGLMGIIGGLLGAGFHHALHFVTGVRLQFTWIVYLLPIGGLLAVGLYRLLRLRNNRGTNEIIDAVLENKPVSSGAPSRKEVMRQFNRMKNRRAIMDTLGFPYNEEMPIAFNAVNFFEWVRANRLWSNLYTAMFQLK